MGEDVPRASVLLWKERYSARERINPRLDCLNGPQLIVVRSPQSVFIAVSGPCTMVDFLRTTGDFADPADGAFEEPSTVTPLSQLQRMATN